MKDFVPHKESLELKALGFDEPCFGYYENGVFIFWYDSKQDYELLLNCSTPTLSQAFRFFREKYNLEASIQRMPPEIYGKGKGNIKNYLLYIWAENLNPRGQQTLHFDTYGEAELECLRKLIEIVKNDSNTASERKN